MSLVRPRVLIGLPNYGKFDRLTTYSLTALACYSMKRGIRVSQVDEYGCSIVRNRAHLTCKAMANGYTHLFMVDADMVFPPNTLEVLLAHDKSIVVCDASRRDEKDQPVVLLEDGDEDRTGVKKVKSVGTGVILIKIGVFNTIPMPHWLEEWNPDTEWYLGSDRYFSKKAREHGYDLWCDFNLSQEIGHVGEKVYWLGGQNRESVG